MKQTYTYNLDYMRMRKLRSNWSIISSPYSRDSWSSLKLLTVLSPNLSRPKFNFRVCIEDDILSKEFYTRKLFLGKVMWPTSWFHLQNTFIKEYPQYCVKVYKYKVFSSPCFSAFALNTEIYSVDLRKQSECGKIRTRKSPYLDTFHAV